MHNFSNLLRFLNYLNLEFSKNNKIEYDLFLDTECKHIDIALLQNVESNASNEGVLKLVYSLVGVRMNGGQNSDVSGT